MQRKTKRIYDIVTIIVNIILLALMILSIVMKSDKVYALYWLFVSLMLLIEVYYIHKWANVDKIDVDKEKSKAIRYSFDGLTTGTICLSGFLYITVMFLEMINASIKNNMFIIIIVYLMLTLSILGNYLAVYSANKDTKELVEKTFNKKN